MLTIFNHLIYITVIMAIYSIAWGFTEAKIKKYKNWVLFEGIVFGLFAGLFPVISKVLPVQGWLFTPLFILIVAAVFINPWSAFISIFMYTGALMFWDGTAQVYDIATIGLLNLGIAMTVLFLKELKFIPRITYFIIAAMMGTGTLLLAKLEYNYVSASYTHIIIGSVATMAILYFYAANIKSIYDHSQKLANRTQYEAGEGAIIKPAFARQALTDFVFDNKVEYGTLVVLNLTGLTNINNRASEDEGDVYVRRVIESLRLSLINTDHIILKPLNNHFGFFIKLDKGDIALDEIFDGNSKLSRKESDPLKMIEDIILEIPTTHKADRQEFKIVVRGGVSLYGIQTCDFNELINYCHYTIEAKNWFSTANVAQLYDTTAHKQFVEDKKDLAYLQDITNIASIYPKFNAIIDTEQRNIFAYSYNMITDDNEYTSYRDLKLETEVHGLTTTLEKLSATFAAKTFVEQTTEEKLILEFPIAAFNDEYYNEVNFIKKLVGYGFRQDRVILAITVKSDEDITPKLIETLDFLQRTGLKILIRHIDSALFDHNWLTILKPDYAEMLMSSSRMWFNKKETKELYSAYAELCKALGIEIIATGVKSTAQANLMIANGITKMNGPYVSTYDTDVRKVTKSIREDIFEKVRNK